MTLIDTSAWVDFFRGTNGLSAAVDRLIEADEAAICGPVVTEIVRGLRSAPERKSILPLLDACHFLAQPRSLWAEAGELGFALGRKGMAVKTMDLLIACHALSHSVRLLTADADFGNMKKAGVDLQLA